MIKQFTFRSICQGVAALVLLSIMSLGALAKGTSIDTDSFAISKTQAAKLRQLFDGLDKQIQAAFKGNEALLQAMQKDLKPIGAMKDGKEKKNAIDTYQAKYLKDYDSILKKAGIDLNQIASKLNVILPGRKFKAQKNFSITANGSESAQTDTVLLGPQTKTVSLLKKMVDHKDLSCGAIAGSGTTFRDDSISNSVFAAEAGGCTNDSDKTLEDSVTAGAQSASIDMKANLDTAAFAVGLAGSAGSGGFTLIKIKSGSNIKSSSVGASVVAPLAWASYAEESLDNTRINQTLDLSENYRVSAGTHTFSVAAGIVAETHANADISNLQVKLSVTQ